MKLDRRSFVTVVGGSALASTSMGTATAAEPTDLADVGGSGTESDPYVLTTAQDLQAIANDAAAHYELGADIDASATADWNGGNGFAPIADFSGTLDGRNHTITGLTIDRPDSAGAGLFENVLRGTIERLSLEGVDIVGGDLGGGVAGMNQEGTVRNVSVDGSVTASLLAGGVVGNHVEGATLSATTSAAEVTSTRGSAGGVVAQSTHSTIEESAATGSVTTDANIAGGLVAICRAQSEIANAYATADVTSAGAAGGLAGVVSEEATVSKTYAAGSVSGVELSGGLVALADGGFVTESYWDQELTGHPGAGDHNTAIEITGLPTADMRGESAAETMSALDFGTTWTTVADGYPALRALEQSADDGGSGSVSADEYAIDGEFTSRSVFEAVSDWRNDEINATVVFEVVSRWRSA
jgi:hypothetical protein